MGIRDVKHVGWCYLSDLIALWDPYLKEDPKIWEGFHISLVYRLMVSIFMWDGKSTVIFSLKKKTHTHAFPPSVYEGAEIVEVTQSGLQAGFILT